MFSFERDLTRWGLMRGRAAFFQDCGLGKTFEQIEWGRLVSEHTNAPVLALAPLAVAEQTRAEGAKFGIPVTLCESQADVKPGVNVTNYQKLHKFEPRFSGIILDECFPWDTPIEVFNIDGGRKIVYIKDIRPGDVVSGAFGKDSVIAVRKRRIIHAATVAAGGRRITSSPNHPFFTQRGWVGASEIQTGDYLLEAKAGVCVLPEGISTEISSREETKVLREILFSELADEATVASKKGSQSRSSCAQRKKQICVVQARVSYSTEGNRTYTESKPDGRSEGTEEGIKDATYDRASTKRTWRERKAINVSTENAIRSVNTDPRTGIRRFSRPEKTRLSDVLQIRFSVAGQKVFYRSRRCFTQDTKRQGARPKEKYEGKWVRVDGISLHEQGDPELERYRQADGFIYFYDLEILRHPSFTIKGFLVHNSSILKSFEGVTRKALTAFSQNIPYRLCCSATPAPNDYMELGTHAEFLGVMSRVEMLATFFVHDSGDTSQWRLKGHARKAYFEWLASWAVAMKRPSDLGYEDEGFSLPPLVFYQHTVASAPQRGRLLSIEVKTLDDRRGARRDSLSERVRVAADLVNSSQEPWVVWCNLNVESEALTKAITGAVEIRGSGQPDAFKVRAAQDFVSGKIRVLVTKPSMFGFGMNWQHCRNMAFVGLSDSYEQFYQAYHRCWRYGQTKEVHCYVICSQAEGAVVKNIQRKEKLAQELSEGMVKHMAAINQTNIQKLTRDTEEYKPTVPMKYFGKSCNGTLVVEQSAQKLLNPKTSPRWLTYHADSVEVLQALPENVIDFSIFSPPFASLYTYTNSERDLGNSHSYKEFFEHFRFIIPELLRVTTPGRLLVCHCANIPATKEHDTYIGIKNFRGHLVDAFEAAGFIYHSEVVIRKDPLVEATRSKAIGLLHKQIIKDSAISRQGLPDYLIVLRKPGTNPKAIQHRPVGFERYIGTRPAPKSKPTDNPMTNKFSHEVWQRYADPVWSDVSQTDTLQFREVREEKDERHICPLQLPVIARALELWTLPNDLVLSPFMGIGSEGYMALRMKRRFIGIELKASYYQMAVKNLIKAANTPERKALF